MTTPLRSLGGNYFRSSRAQRTCCHFLRISIGVGEAARTAANTAFFGPPAPGADHNLTATSIASGTPTVGSPALTQRHNLTATGVNSGTPTVGSPALTQRHALTATGINSGVPTVGSPALTQNHSLTATGIASGVPTVGSPALTQNHSLTANSISAGAPTVGSPELTSSGGGECIPAFQPTAFQFDAFQTCEEGGPEVCVPAFQPNAFQFNGFQTCAEAPAEPPAQPPGIGTGAGQPVPSAPNRFRDAIREANEPRKVRKAKRKERKRPDPVTGLLAEVVESITPEVVAAEVERQRLLGEEINEIAARIELARQIIQDEEDALVVLLLA